MTKRNSIDYIGDKIDNLSLKFKKKNPKTKMDYTKNYEDADILATNTRSEYNAAQIKIRLNKDEVDQLVTAFKMFDKNGDGDMYKRVEKRSHQVRS